jgi:hypothetical protein
MVAPPAAFVNLTLIVDPRWIRAESVRVLAYLGRSEDCQLYAGRNGSIRKVCLGQSSYCASAVVSRCILYFSEGSLHRSDSTTELRYPMQSWSMFDV